MLSHPETFEDSEELSLTSFSELEHRGRKTRGKLSLSSVEDDDFTFENVSEHGSPAVLPLHSWLSSALPIAGSEELSTFLSGRVVAAFCPPSLVSSPFFSLYWTEYSAAK
jgi:hypothetical protein